MTERVNITLPAELLAKLDAAAKSEHLTRSGYLRAAVLERVALGGAGVAGETAAVYASSPTAPVLSAPPLSDLAARLRAFLIGYGGAVAAYLFGSVARGDAGPMSDVDVAVLLPWSIDRSAALDVEIDLRDRLARALGAERVDVVVLNNAPVRLAWRAVAEGEVVFGEHAAERVDFELAAWNRYQDFKPLLDSMASGVRERIADGRFGT